MVPVSGIPETSSSVPLSNVIMTSFAEETVKAVSADKSAAARIIKTIFDFSAVSRIFFIQIIKGVILSGLYSLPEESESTLSAAKDRAKSSLASSLSFR